MKLGEYLEQPVPGRRKALADRLEVSASFLSQVALNKRPCPAVLAVEIEVATEREVKRWDLRASDWHRIWPELIGAEGAPAVPEAEARDAA